MKNRHLVPLLLAFLSILSLSSTLFPEDADAQAPALTKFKQDRASEHWSFGNGTFVYVSGGLAPPSVFDIDTGQWVKLDVDSLGGNDYRIASSLIGTNFIGETITHFDVEDDSTAGTEELKIMRKTTGQNFEQITKSLVSRTVQENVNPITKEISGIMVNDVNSTGVVNESWTTSFLDMDIDYFYLEARPMKHTFTGTQTASQTDTYRLYHRFTMDGVSKYITPNGQEFNIPVGSLTLSKNQLSLLLGDNHPHLRFNDGLGNLKLVEIIAPTTSDPAWNNFIEVYLENTGTQIIAEFRYGDWTVSQGQSFELDPDTYSSNNPTQDGYITTTSTTGSACGSPSTKDSTDSILDIQIGDSDLSQPCRRMYSEWDITSIPDSADVTDTHFKFDISSFTNPRNCDFNEMATQPSPASASTIWTDIGDGTNFVSNNTICTTVGDNKDLDLGTSADTDVESQLSSNWFATGGKYTDEVRDSVLRQTRIESEESTVETPAPTLEVTYTVPPVYVVDLLSVYESSSTTLGSGTAICTSVDLETTPSSCGTAINAGTTYRFEVTVRNDGTGVGSPTTFDFDAVVASSDVLGSIPVGNILNSGCSTNIDWTESIVSTDARASSGTTCSISASGGTAVFWMIVTLDTDANDGTGTFTITDGTVSDTSTLTTFTVNTPPAYNIDLIDVYQSASTTLDTGTIVCQDIDTDTAQSCGTLNANETYRFEWEVDNTGEQAGSPDMFQFRDVVAVNDVLGTIVAGAVLNSGCSTNINWIESIVTNDVQSDAGTTCSIGAGGNAEYWAVITIDPDANDGSGTFYIEDASGRTDTSALTSFTVNTPPSYVVDLLDVYQSSSTTLGSGTVICLDVDLEIADSCDATLNGATTYRFEVEVDNIGEQAGSPNILEFRDVVASSDVLGTILAGDILNSGCSTNVDWVESIVTDDAKTTAGTTCSISGAGNAIYWMVITIDTDAGSGTGTFFIDDGTRNDVSTLTTFSVTSLPDYVIELLDVYESSSTTLGSGTAICENVNLQSPSSCGTKLTSNNTYRFEVQVNNTGVVSGSPNSLALQSSVGAGDVLGSIPVGNILNSGCSTNIDWTESIVGGTDATATSGTTCSIAVDAIVEYWMIVTLDNDANDGTTTFSITDGTTGDTSTLTTFDITCTPTSPTGLTAPTQSISQIDQSWTNPTNCSLNANQVFQSTDDIVFSSIFSGAVTTTNSNTALSSNTNYHYKVRAQSIADSIWSANTTSIQNSTISDAPTALTADQSETINKSIDLSWTSPAGNAVITGYKIERESPIAGGFSTLVSSTGNSQTTYTDSNLTVDQVYNYKTSAINQGGTSTASNEDSSTPSVTGVNPASGGGGSSALPTLPSLQNLMLFDITFRTTINQKIDGIWEFQWDQQKIIKIVRIEIDEYESWFQFGNLPITLTPEVISEAGFLPQANALRVGAKIPYSIITPPQFCDVELGITENCAEMGTLEIPVRFILNFEGTEWSRTSFIILEITEFQVNPAQIQTLLLGTVVIGAVIGGITLRQKLAGRQRGKKIKSSARDGLGKSKFEKRLAKALSG